LKLLIDQNLSPKLVSKLGQGFEGSVHVRDLGLAAADDRVIWDQARTDGFVVLSKDDDFYQRSVLLGHPPKVIWVQLGNASTNEVLAAIHRHKQSIAEFGGDPIQSVMVIHRSGSLRS
jgi:predicted nuclease of predicted toxin-antitoxin system